MIRAGCRAVQSTPLITRGDRAIGVVSTLHARRDELPDAAALARIDMIVQRTSGWLDWHRSTIVLDALERLHTRALPAARQAE